MVKRKKDKQRSTKHYTKNKKLSNTNPNKNRDEHRKGNRSCSTSGTHPSLYSKIQTQGYVMNEERTRKCLRWVEHISGHL
jgi:hypothetical protein